MAKRWGLLALQDQGSKPFPNFQVVRARSRVCILKLECPHASIRNDKRCQPPAAINFHFFPAVKNTAELVVVLRSKVPQDERGNRPANQKGRTRRAARSRVARSRAARWSRRCLRRHRAGRLAFRNAVVSAANPGPRHRSHHKNCRGRGSAPFVLELPSTAPLEPAAGKKGKESSGRVSHRAVPKIFGRE